VRAQRVGEGTLELHTLGEKLQERLPGQALGTGTEQALRGGIGVPDDELTVERDDRRGEQFESREGQASP
jgi:hypothetical protein